MHLTRQSEIAIGALTACARKPDGMTSTREVADATGTTKDHAAQVVARLVRHGYLESARGRAGGIRLARPAAHIGVGEVLRLTEPSFAETPQEADASTDRGLCFAVLRRAAEEAYIATFDTFTVADLVADLPEGRVGCLDCGLGFVARHGRTLSRLRQHAA